MNDQLERLNRIFREILDEPGLEISSEFSMADHPGWDSVATVQIVLAAEQEFSCRLPTEAVAGLKNVGDLLKHLPRPAAGTPSDGKPEEMAEGGPAKARAEALLESARRKRDDGDTAGALADLRLAFLLYQDFNFCTQAARLLDAIAAQGATPAQAAPLKIALLASSTTELVAPLLRLACFRDGLWAQVYAAPFGSYRQEILDPASALYRFGPDIAIIALNWRDAHLPEFSDIPSGAAKQTVAELAELWRMLAERTRCTIVQHNFDLPAWDSTGHLGAADRRGRTRLLRAINEGLEEAAPEGVIVLDFEGVSSQFGKDAWESPEWWHVAKQHPAAEALPLLVDRYLALIRARLGLARKVLVFDLDNTLWGGVIGEDGLGGIKVGPPSPEGEAHAALQQYALELKRRGILLAVCSKNNESDARLPFRGHEGMVLKEDDFVAFVANWEHKPANLREIARQLNLGLDSFVFVDDSPVERAMMRRELPEVAVVELGSDPAVFVRALHRGYYFESLALSREDSRRHDTYRSNVRREELRAGAANLDEFLGRLRMTVSRGEFSDHVFDRVVQLLGKTNQFNLTTRRHSAETVRALMNDRRAWTQYFRLVDCYGDNGIVGLAIACECGPAEWEIDTLLMSCRVIGRRLEDFMIRTLLEAAQAAGCERVRGLFQPTAKNGIVADFYPRLGFGEDSARARGPGRVYFWDLAGRPFPEVPFFAVEEAQR